MTVTGKNVKRQEAKVLTHDAYRVLVAPPVPAGRAAALKVLAEVRDGLVGKPGLTKEQQVEVLTGLTTKVTEVHDGITTKDFDGNVEWFAAVDAALLALKGTLAEAAKFAAERDFDAYEAEKTATIAAYEAELEDEDEESDEVPF